MATNKQRKLNKIKEVRGEKAQKVQELWALETPDNDLTEDQKAEILELTREIEQLKVDEKNAEADVQLEREVNEAAGKVEPEEKSAVPDFGTRPPSLQFEEQPKSLGDQFIESKEYKSLIDDGGLPQGKWSMNTVELSTKATLLSGGTIGGYGPFQQSVPGVIPIADQPVVVTDLLPQNTATAPQVQYFKERVATNAAAGVAEGAVKPEATFDFEAETALVRKIAVWLPVSDEMMEDAPAISTYLNSRLAGFIRTQEEWQLLRGSAAGNEVDGFIDSFTTTGVGTALATGAPGTASFGDIATIMNDQRGSSFLDPDALIMHPAQFGSILGAFDTNGQYYSGGPLSPGAYGAGRQVNASRFSAWSLWQVPVHITTQVGNGTMLLGNFSQGAAVWRRGGLSVQASNAHDDFFVRNQTAIRAEERLALTIYRPEAFTVITWS